MTTAADIASGLDKPRRINPREWTACCPAHDDRNPSLSLSDGDDGRILVHCHAGCEQDVVIAALKTRGLWPDTAATPRRMNGKEHHPPEHRPTTAAKAPTWELVAPVPDDAPAPTFKHKRHGAPSTVWAYRDAGGRLLGHIARFDRPDGGKEILPRTLWRAGAIGRLEWRWKAFPKPRPLYGLDRLAIKPGGTVIIVEGEKAADAALGLLPACVVMTWPGGSSAVKHADWTPLKGHKVVIIPDADAPGIKAAEAIAAVLDGIAAGVRIVDPPDGLPAGWDLADALADGWTQEQARAFVKDHLRGPGQTPRDPRQSRASEPPHDDALLIDAPDDYDGDHALIDAPYKPLGYNRGRFYFLAARGRQVIEATGRALLDKGTLFQLAPLHVWERDFPGDKGFAGKAVDCAANALMNACYRAGIFSPERMRGRGAWWDDGRVVLHLGDRLIVDRSETDISDIASRYVYEAAAPVRCSLDNSLSTKDSHRLYELCEMLFWERPVYATLLAGWCVVAPICGAINWRPHIWITSAAAGGKSWVMDNIVRRCLGDIGLVVQSRTTEAGLRQTLGHDARPVLFDEAESEDRRAAAGIENVLALMRQASSESGGKIIKGSAGGKAVSFDIRSCFAFASIGVNIQQHADATRITVLGLIKDNSPEGQRHFRETIKPTAFDLLTPEYCARLQARAIRFVNVIRQNAEVFGEAAAERLGDRRLGDQLGALLAGAYLLHSSGTIEMDAARKWVQAQNWEDQTETLGECDEVNLLSFLMESRHRVTVPGTAVERNAGELVARAAEINVDDGDKVGKETAVAALARIGMKVADDWLVVSNSHSGIKRILKDTPWATGWGRILKRIDGAEISRGGVRFGPLASRAVLMPLQAAISID